MKQAITAAVVFALLALSGCGDMALRDMIVDLVTKAAVTVPEAPSGLSANSLSVSRIHLAWTDNSSNETGFKIERSPDGSSGWTQVQLTAADATTWDDSGLSVGTAYYYRMRASNASGDSPYSNIASGTTDPYLPSFASGVAIKAAGDSIAMGDGTYGPNPAVAQTISYNFTMSKYEITNDQFAQFFADGGYSTSSYWTTNGWTYKENQVWTQPAYWTDANFNGDNQPVVGVSWYEAVAYCNWRSVNEGLTAAYNSSGQANLSATGYRLPTEVEWEYAAAKGASGQAERIYAWGDTWDSSKAVCNATRTADVGSKSIAGGGYTAGPG
jgi:formylglycine-generating enzyme required for sulfatase activity